MRMWGIFSGRHLVAFLVFCSFTFLDGFLVLLGSGLLLFKSALVKTAVHTVDDTVLRRLGQGVEDSELKRVGPVRGHLRLVPDRTAGDTGVRGGGRGGKGRLPDLGKLRGDEEGSLALEVETGNVGVLRSERARHHRHVLLRRAVPGKHRRRGGARTAPNAHHGAPLAVNHAGQDQPGHPVGRVNVQLNKLLRAVVVEPVVQLRVLVRHSHVVHQHTHLQVLKLLAGDLDGRVAAAPTGEGTEVDRKGVELDLRVLLLQLLGRVVELRLSAGDQQDIQPLPRQFVGEGLPDPVSRARHHSPLTVLAQVLPCAQELRVHESAHLRREPQHHQQSHTGQRVGRDVGRQHRAGHFLLPVCLSLGYLDDQ
eukprot:Hpha_TRINITY_DN16670_c1_g9::TRINITY_DN16670_c1_g9_i1::g.178717::m.178717